MIPWGFAAEDFDYALREAVTNAVRHGSNNDATKIVRVSLVYCPLIHTVMTEISDTGPGFDTSKSFRAEHIEGLTYHCCGRWWMTRACDSVTYERRGGWWVCTLVKTL